MFCPFSVWCIGSDASVSLESVGSRLKLWVLYSFEYCILLGLY
jgi:hypothetical protein